LLAWLRDYLCHRKQRVLLFGATSDIVSITAEVTQGSIRGPRFIPAYFNDIVTDIPFPIRLFADDPQRTSDSTNADLA